MTFDRRDRRTSREINLDMESLGERIAPAVYHPGFGAHLASWNLQAEFQKREQDLVMNERRLQMIEKLHRLPPIKPFIVSGPAQYPMLNIMVANTGSSSSDVSGTAHASDR